MISDINYENTDVILLFSEVAKLLENKDNKKNSKTVFSQKASRSIIFSLASRDGLTQNQLVREIHMKGSTISICINSLEKQGYVKRKSSEFDSRANQIFLTDKGYDFYDKLKEEKNSEKKYILKGITPKEERELIYILYQMKENLIKQKEEN